VLDSRADALINDVLEYIEDGRVIPIIGEELLQVVDGGATVPLYTYLARTLAKGLEISPDALPPHATLNEVVCHHLRTGGVPEDIHPKVRPIINSARFEPPEPLRQLAAIDRLNLFVVLTFDSLLANAIDEVRFGGESRTAELAYSPNNVQDLPEPHGALRRPVVYHLLGKLSAGPDYVITEEDTLEFMHHMQRQGRSAGNLFDALRDSHLLFIGCTFSDWLARFLIRITKSRQLSQRRTEMELIVGSNADRDTNLVQFLRHFSPRTKIVSCPPAEFVAELEARYRSRTARARQDTRADRAAPVEPAPMEEGAIFISYTRNDERAARNLSKFLEEEAGADVWLDTSELQLGDEWDRKIQRNIKNCSYFMPLISSHSTDRHPGYFQREWRWAVDRSMDFAEGSPFILPIVVDETPKGGEGVPDRFAQAQWMRLPDGEGNAEFRRLIVNLIRDYRKRTRG
jgi:hypothetical protein